MILSLLQGDAVFASPGRNRLAKWSRLDLQKRTTNTTRRRRSMRRIRDARHSCMLLESALDRSQSPTSLREATGA